MPRVANYQADILSRVSAATGMVVTAEKIEGGWSGFSPFLEITALEFREPDNIVSPTRTAGAIALSLPRVRTGVSIPYLFLGQTRITDFSVFSPALSLVRASDGLIYFAGRAINQKSEATEDGRFFSWLIAQPGITLSNATLTWRDDLTPGSDLRFSNVGLRITKRFGRHNMGFIATPPEALAKSVSAQGAFTITQDSNNLLGIEGALFAEVDSANLAELRRHLVLADRWQAGVGNVRAWIDLDTGGVKPSNEKSRTNETLLAAEVDAPNRLKAITADVHIINARAQLGADTSQLNLAQLAGRLNYTRLDNGFQIGSKKLTFRTNEGVVSPAADFSFSRQFDRVTTKQSGAITANGIDLKAITAMIQYFPIGRDLRETVTKFAARGALNDASFQWTGELTKPTTYQVKAALANFALLANERIPGFSNFSGTVEGSEKGGEFIVASQQFTFDARTIFSDVIKLDRVDSQGKWTTTPNDVAVEFNRLSFSNSDLSAEVKAIYTRKREQAGVALAAAELPGSIDLQGKISNVGVAKVARYLPNGLAKTREFIGGAARDGVIESVDVVLKGRVFDFPFHLGQGGQFRLTAKLKNLDMRYAEGWPQVNNINGELILENTALSAKVTSATLSGGQIRKATLGITDTFIKPYLLTIAGEADARGEEVSQFFIQSPLIDGVGAFTKSVAIEGAGKLSIQMAIPLGIKPEDANNPLTPKFRLSGNYTLSRGSAKPVVSAFISDVNGSVAFTESSVKSSVITGVAYGNPITVKIASLSEPGARGAQSGVATEFAVRADVQQLGTLLPFAMPKQITGSTDFTGRILAKGGSVDVTVDAPMRGVTSSLPYPLTKRVDEVRPLKLAFNNIGKPHEKMRVTLMGNRATATVSAADSKAEAKLTAFVLATIPTTTAANANNADNLDTRIDVRIQRRVDKGGNSSFVGALVNVGAASASEVAIPTGIWLVGTMPQLNFDEWLKAAENFVTGLPSPTGSTSTAAGAKAKSENNSGIDGSGADANFGDSGNTKNNRDSAGGITGIDFNLGRLTAYGRPFDNIKIKGRRDVETWAMSASSKELDGDFTWRASAFDERGAVRARLKKLVLADEPASVDATANIPIAELKQTEGDLPALDIVADEFSFKGRWLGKLELNATPQVDSWKIDKLDISNGHVKIEMDGIWQRYGDPFQPPSVGSVKSLTTMNVKIDSSNLNALFNQFGFGDQMRGGRGGLEGKISWPGHSYQFQLASLAGEFTVNAERGQFAKITPGAGKLLGLISLQSIPRRLTFDFRDLFSEGFAFDSIDGDLTITNGIIFAKKFDINGPAANVKMTGDISLPNERQNLTLIVAPKLSGVAAVGTALLVNPVVGLGVLLGGELLRSPLEKVLSVQYSVTGTWDNPVVDRTGKVVAPATPATPAIPATPTATPIAPALQLIPAPATSNPSVVPEANQKKPT